MTMRTAGAPPRPVRREWVLLDRAGLKPATFDVAMTAGLPEPAQRWLRHSIVPGTPLWPIVDLSMRGRLRLGRSWRRFRATQVLRPPNGFIWAARSSFAGLPVTGYDRLSSGTGAMRWRLLGLIPVMSAVGPDITRSAAGRLASELVLVPTTFRRALWRPDEDPDRTTATVRIGSEIIDVTLHVGVDGTLLDVLVQRWGAERGQAFGYRPFGASFGAERAFGGVTIPVEISAGWWWGTDRQAAGEFFRATITEARFR